MVRVVVLWAIPLTVAAWLVRSALVVVLRPRWPAAARWVDRWWAWAPLGAFLAFLTVAAPVVGAAAIVVTYLFLTSSRAVGSPFRPRR